MATLTATTRKAKTGLGKLRTEGKVPAVIYGGIPEPLSVSLDEGAFKKAWKDAGGSSTVTVETDNGAYECIIHDYDLDPVTEKVVHVDLLALDKDKKVEVEVELSFAGISPAVKSGLGVLEKMLHQVKVEALPRDLPKSLEVDISVLAEVGSQILVKDLVFAATVTVKENPEEVVAVITHIKEEKEEAGAPIDFTQIEVEKKGKKEEEGEAEPEAK